jgi:hypothetical protein
MKWSDLQQRFGARVPLTPEQWARALLLGRAREQTNATRAASSDRGSLGNHEVDLHGALGELLLYEMVEPLPKSAAALEYMRCQLFCVSGGREVSGPDLSFHDDDDRLDAPPVGIDVKTFDCAPRKRLFAINARKHTLLSGQCLAYMALVCPRWAHSACVMRPVPYTEVSTWECRALRPGPGGSESRNLPMDVAFQRYGVPEYSIEQNRQKIYPETQIKELARQKGAGTPIARLLDLLPDAKPYLVKAQANL